MMSDRPDKSINNQGRLFLRCVPLLDRFSTVAAVQASKTAGNWQDRPYFSPFDSTAWFMEA